MGQGGIGAETGVCGFSGNEADPTRAGAEKRGLEPRGAVRC